MPKGSLYRDAVLGPLVWDVAWRGSADLTGGPVAVSLPTDNDDPAELPAYIAVARTALGWLRANEAHARRCVAAHLLERTPPAPKPGQRQLTGQEFADRLRATAVDFWPDGAFTVDYANDIYGYLVAADFEATGALKRAWVIG